MEKATITIVHYFLGFEPIHNGGLLIYVENLVSGLKKKGFNVILLFPGLYNKINVSKIKYYKKIKNIDVFQIVNAQKISFTGIKKPNEFIKERVNNNYKEFFKNNNVKLLHIHSLMGLPKELIDVAKRTGVKIVFTTHDYFGLCPKINLFNYKREICNDFNDGNECIKCNAEIIENSVLKRNLTINYRKIFLLKEYFSKNNVVKDIINQLKKFKKKNKIFEINYNNNIEYIKFREYYINIIYNCDLVLFNSLVTMNVFNNYLKIKNIKHDIIPLTHNGIKDNRKMLKYDASKNNIIKIIFVGGDNEIKGLYYLLNVLEHLRKDGIKNWSLYIYGALKNKILKNMYKKPYYYYHGSYKHKYIEKIFSEKNLFIMPSIWNETYGFVALEAYSYGIPMILPNNVGFSMFIEQNKNGFVYNSDKNGNNIKECLKLILKNPETLNNIHKNIVDDNNFNNFLMEKHINEIINKYNYLTD